jgi:arylsulfatase A-like enzyme
VGKLHLTPQQEGVAEAPYFGFDRVEPVEDNSVGPYLDWALKNYPEHAGYLIGTLFNIPANPDYWKGRRDFRNEVQACRAAHVLPREISATCNWGFGHYSPLPEEAHKNTWITDRATGIVKGHDTGKPLCLWVGYVDPHNPFDPPGRFQRMYDPDAVDAPVYRPGEEAGWTPHHKALHAYTGAFTDRDWRVLRSLFYGSVTFMDEQIGRLLAAVESRLDMSNTIILYLSDHGDILGDHRIIGKNCYHYDGGIRVPLLARWDGRWKAGVKTDAFVEQPDIVPTLLQACGLDTTSSLPPDGLSFAPVLDGSSQAGPRDHAFIESFSGAPEDRTPAPANWARTIRTEGWRATFYPGPVGELYDLRNDPCESVNLFGDPRFGGVVEQHRRILVDRLTRLDYPLRKTHYAV